MKFTKLAIGLACCSAFTAQAVTVIDTTPYWDGKLGQVQFGVYNTSTYGQTFTTGATDTVLQSFSFFLSPLQPAGSGFYGVDYYAGVGTWDGSKIGSVVYESAPMKFGAPVDIGIFKEVTISTGNLLLAPNTQHVAFFSTAGLQVTGVVGTSQWGLVDANVYAGGNFVYQNSEDYKPALIRFAWDGVGSRDLAFKATLVPEPETYAMMLAGLGVLGAVARRRKAA